jgi:DNA-binding transcriptional ArsR family regulator
LSDCPIKAAQLRDDFFAKAENHEPEGAMRGKAKGGESVESAKATARLTKALEHDLRLRIMRLSIERSAPVNPREAAKDLSGAALSNVAYHFRVLAEVDALVPSGTPSVHGDQLYSPNPLVVQAPMVEELLAAPSQASS